MANTITIKMDRNGNKVAYLKTPYGGFSIQTNGNLPETHRRFSKGTLKTLAQYDVAVSEMIDYVEDFGTERQKKIMKRIGLIQKLPVKRVYR